MQDVVEVLVEDDQFVPQRQDRLVLLEIERLRHHRKDVRQHSVVFDVLEV